MKQSPILEFESMMFPVAPDEDEETNPGISGKELANWLSARLLAAGIRADEPFAEDFGWCVPVECTSHSMHVACASSEDGPNRWMLYAFAEGGLFARMLGKDKRELELQALFSALRTCIESEAAIRDVTLIER